MASLVKSCRFSFSSSVTRRCAAGVRLWSSSNEVTVKEKKGGDLTEYVNPDDLVKLHFLMATVCDVWCINK